MEHLFLSRAQSSSREEQELVIPLNQTAATQARGCQSSESPSVARVIVLPRKWLLVSSSVSVFSTPGHIGGSSRVALPAFVVHIKRSSSPSVALKSTLTAPDSWLPS